MPETRCAPAHWGTFLLTGSTKGLSETEAPVASGWVATLRPLKFTKDLGPDGEGVFGLGEGIDPYEGPLHRFEMTEALDA